jgi:hypothetical protein
VDRVLAFTALTQRDIQDVFALLLAMENRLRRRRQYQLALPQHERLPLRWDHQVLAALAQNKLGGGYSAGFARQGAAKCLEVLEQLLDDLALVECPDREHAYRLGVSNRHGVMCECEPEGSDVAIAHGDL